MEAAEAPQERLLRRRITVFRQADGGWRRSDELHSLRLYPRQDLLDLLASTGFHTRLLAGYLLEQNRARGPGGLVPHRYGTLMGSRGAATDQIRHARHPLHRKGAFESTEAVMTVVGRVAALWRYPVKSMAAEELDRVEVSWHGLAGDRRWAFIRDGQVRSGFPWLTIRERPELAYYQPRFAEPDRPNASPTLVRTPSGGELDVADPALAAELGPGIRVIKQDRGVFDTMPLSLLTTQTLTGLGGLRMRVDQRDKRCVMVTIDPVTLDRDPAILRAIARERDARLGVYGSTVEPGRVAVGDPVELEP